MTDEMLALQGLLEKKSDADLLRDMPGFAAKRLPPGPAGSRCFAVDGGGPAARRGGLDVDTKTGAAWGEMSAERLVQHNGYRDRVWETRGEAFAVSRKLLTFLDAIVRGRKPWQPP